MTEREKLRCDEMKLRKSEKQNHKCPVCNARLLWNSQLAHRINQGPNNIKNLEREFKDDYGRGIGKKIIHHRFNMVLTCPGPCNSSVLVDNKPVKRANLLIKILEDIGGKNG